MALAAASARTGKKTLLLSRRAHDGALPGGVTIARDDAQVGREARLIFLAVPSGVVREVARGLGAHLDGRHFVVHGVRGLVGERLQTISDVVREETPVRRMGALGGPALASDLLAGRPSVMVCGSRYPEVLGAVEAAFASPTLRLYSTLDLLGLEWASALVGCLAIGVGYARGIGLGPGLMAAVITRAVEEAARLASAAGGEERTLLGLAGYGDMLASIAQTERPEVLVGEALARGKTVAQAVADAKQRVEAVDVAGRIAAWAERAGVRAPIMTTLAKGILAGRAHTPGGAGSTPDAGDAGLTPDALVQQLMTAPRP